MKKKIVGFSFCMAFVLFFVWWGYYAVSTSIIATETENVQFITIDLSDFNGEILHDDNVNFASILDKGSTSLEWIIDTSSVLSTLSYYVWNERIMHFDLYHPKDGMCNLYYKYKATQSLIPDESKKSRWHATGFKTELVDNHIIATFNYHMDDSPMFVYLFFLVIYILLIVWFINSKYHKLISKWAVVLWKKVF